MATDNVQFFARLFVIDGLLKRLLAEHPDRVTIVAAIQADVDEFRRDQLAKTPSAAGRAFLNEFQLMAQKSLETFLQPDDVH